MTKPSPRFARLAAVLGMALWTAFAGPTLALAQSGMSIVRDAEIEALVRDYARPILQAAGLSKSNIQIVLVNDPRFNAFVVGRRIFVNTGALMMAQTPNEIIGVLAHESGHIAGGHQDRLREQLERAQTMAIVSALLGAGAIAAGAASGNGEIASAGAGLAAGGGEFARRGILAYQRTEEISADRAAISYLNATGQSAKGMLETFKRFQTALSLSGTSVDPYQMSHPVPQRPHRQPADAGRAEPLFQRQGLAHPAAAARSGTRQDRGLHRRSRHCRQDVPQQSRPAGGELRRCASTFLRGNPRAAVTKAEALIKAAAEESLFSGIAGRCADEGQPPGRRCRGL